MTNDEQAVSCRIPQGPRSNYYMDDLKSSRKLTIFSEICLRKQNNKYSQPSIRASSATTNRKYLGKKFASQVFIQHLCCIYNYLYSICTALCITSNLEMISSIQEDVCKSHANTTPFYRRDLSI